MIIIPIKWLFHWGYTPFSDIPKCFQRRLAACWTASEQLTVSPCVPLKRSSEILTRQSNRRGIGCDGLGSANRGQKDDPGCELIRFIPFYSTMSRSPQASKCSFSLWSSKWFRAVILSHEVDIIHIYLGIKIIKKRNRYNLPIPRYNEPFNRQWIVMDFMFNINMFYIIIQLLDFLGFHSEKNIHKPHK